MKSLPILAYPKFSQPFTNVLGTAIGAILIQNSHLIAYFSKKLSPTLQKSSIYAREFYAIIETVGRWRQYLLGNKFTIRTDQKSIRELM